MATTTALQAWPTSKIRQTFIDFFIQHKHTFVASSPSVPLNDPTLLFTNAGMNQFKDIFTGQLDTSSERGALKCVANSQKCIRAGGKHNDLEDVGRDTYHHTFFEMLGNWSFGDYFKAEMIPLAWKLLTEVYLLPKDQLYVTYFEGSEEMGLPPDLEARDLWLQFIPEDRIIKGNMKDNFWEMGDVGPCGPCSEIHFDRIGQRNAAHLVNQDDPMVLEIWNIVFIQFSRQPDRSLLTLPDKHIDTGMGLERLSSILQNVKSNYDTDLWKNLFDGIQQATGYEHGYFDAGCSNDAIVAYRVIADHIRMLTVSIIDGAIPDNVGRGYVLRRVVRRAVRFGHEFLGAKVGFFSQLVTVVSNELGDFFPELKEPKNIARAKALILEEEQTFAKTWTSGLKHFHTMAKAVSSKNGSSIAGEDAFILHDRYGFPVDLTVLMAEKEKLQVDIQGFHKAMEAHQKAAGEKSKASTTFLDGFALDKMRKSGVPVTQDNDKYTWNTPLHGVKILQLFDAQTKAVIQSSSELPSGSTSIALITDKTSFYAEAGGQIYDTGVIQTENGEMHVEKVVCCGGYICHIGTLKSGVLHGSDAKVSMHVDYARRLLVGSNHTMTHVLNNSLRKVLQYAREDSFVEVNQKGSYVSDEFLRFDFSWNNKLETTELADIECDMKAAVEKDLKVYTKEVPYKTALQIKSLRCMFDEKYGDTVTVVSIGIPVEDVLQDPENESYRTYSIELCGGTHISSLKQAQNVAILAEDALTKGVRRMTVVTGQLATNAYAEGHVFEEELEALSSQKGGPIDYDERLKSLTLLGKRVNESNACLLTKIKVREALQEVFKTFNAAKKEHVAEALKQATLAGKQLAQSLSADVKFLVTKMDEKVLPSKDGVQTYLEAFLAVKNIPVFLFALDISKNVGIAMASSGDAKLNAVEWLKASVGKGGGKPSLAQGGFVEGDLSASLEKAIAFATQISL